VANDLTTVTFESTKNGVAREVPVLFQWVRDGLAELRESCVSVRDTQLRRGVAESGWSFRSGDCFLTAF